jgi:hypothetical protein
MRRLAFLIAVLLTPVDIVFVVPQAKEAAAASPEAGGKLIGTWKFVSGKYGGQEVKFPPGMTMIKHVTPEQFMWARYDDKGNLSSAAGGPQTIKGDDYIETPKYGIGGDFDEIKEKSHTFKWKVEGNKWYHDGKLDSGLTIEEIWERVEK